MNLTLGHIAYINCAPFFHHLSQCGFDGRILCGVPSHLNRLLAEGEVDVSPSSSFEYARNWRDYLLLPELSISSCGEVKSVLLFSNRTLEELGDAEIAITGDSATSVNMLHVILREFYGLRHYRCQVPSCPVEEVMAAGGTALLIGDRALKAAQQPPLKYVYDLGDLWLQHTGLPFVFALWILRRQAASDKCGQVRELQRQLHRSKDMAFGSLSQMAAETLERSWMGETGLVDYWNCLSYDLGNAHLEGLNLYFHLCVRHGLLDEIPELAFFS
jgi:chorismate dehydratase